ncbi:hypothetical protein G7Y31_06865 [Corynebacterium lizhenjunii]|uniref:Uncharacterized protein n=1 Tax=Corynebacterium lizhenjunii TaxID=2709394 RepID=A0A7T0KCL1_9CORY|nr:hypothetical protein [Corynebacterium lizhenjunii]QPK78305.1 hypothetical protein G7Y31_06865 [Corynebacterium lizhenjunii]
MFMQHRNFDVNAKDGYATITDCAGGRVVLGADDIRMLAHCLDMALYSLAFDRENTDV